ncbi:MAG: UDP-N-acetylmuramoyl-L-alanyl-D-glutamate--2,6-diaminopimelate ligase [Fimbriimonadia bacterium]|nr:UDP-N-acetylmuramoyl-L-alanyl-D-glutamate--2,6-diaminopimelate ligase [Fimbriimonadia bacterium]
MRFLELMNGLNAEISGDTPIQGLCVDTRALKKGDLYIALVGSRQDGHEFLPEAIQAGAAAALISNDRAAPENLPVYARVPDTRIALWQIAQRFYNDPSRHLRLIGLTGTNGKTTASHLLHSILESAGIPVALIGTLGCKWKGDYRDLGFTTPEVYQLQAILQEVLADGARATVMEVSSHALAQMRVDGARFDIGVFLNLTQDHLDFHHTMEEYANAKLRLFTELAEQSEKPFHSLLNLDSEWGDWFLKRASGKVIGFGTAPESAIRAVNPNIEKKGLRFQIESPYYERFDVALQLSAPYNLSNGLAAAAAALVLGISTEAIQQGLQVVERVPGRFERVPLEQDFSVYVDFAHTPDALENVLKAARDLKPQRLVILFGAGGDRDARKRPLMGRAACEWADRVILTSDNPRTEDPQKILDDILQGIEPDQKNKVVVEPDRKRAIHLALQEAQPGDLILLAGKGHENYQIIGEEKIPFEDRQVVLDFYR